MQLPQIAGLHHLAVDHVALHRPAILHAASHHRNVGTAKSERRINVVLRQAFRTKAVSSGGRIWGEGSCTRAIPFTAHKLEWSKI